MKNAFPLLNFPDVNIELDKDDDGPQIFDPFRKKWLVCTPEEWVRQHLLAYLYEYKKYPRSLLKVEGSVEAFGQKRRFDAVVYSREISPLMIVECKAPTVKISDKTLQQIAVYHSSLKTPYLLISNGIKHFCCKMKTDGRYAFLDDIPDYEMLLKNSKY